MLVTMNEHRSKQRSKEIGAQIKRAREVASLSQEGLGSYFKVSGATVSRWEAGQVDLGVPTLEEIARILDQPLQFFTGQATPPRDSRMEALGREVLRLVEQQPGIVERQIRGQSGSRRFQVENRVSASDAEPSESQLEDEIDVPDAFWRGAKWPRIFYVAGDCLRPEGIVSGDHMIVDGANVTPREGDIVVARVNGTLTMKCFYRLSDRVELRPAAPGFEMVTAVDGRDKLEIIGVFHNVVPTGKRGRR